MSTSSKSPGLIAVIVLGMTATASGQDKPAADQEIAAAIARRRLPQARPIGEGHWNEPAQPQHQLGMTALAGLALLENGVARDCAEIGKARELVAELARAVGSNVRPRAGDPVPGTMSARTSRGVRRLDPDPGTPAGGRRPRGDLGL